MPNRLPLSRTQLVALLAAIGRELGGGLRTVAREVDMWRRRAEQIPSVPLREDALRALDCKRGHTDGAALFWTLPSRRNADLLRLLVAYELIWDFLDEVSERGATRGVENGRQLFAAVADALSPGGPTQNYYQFHDWKDDGGYLDALVAACRRHSEALPSFSVVRPLIARETARAPVLGLNHEPDPRRLEEVLRDWTAAEFPHGQDGLLWYELSAAASQSLVTHALLALAAEPAVTRTDAEATYAAYFPWFGFVGTMLDSYVDRAEDLAAGAHSYVAHYPSREIAVQRLCMSIDRSARDVLALQHGERHAVLLGCMIAMYLSKDSARAGEMRAMTSRLVRAGGSLPRLLLPVLRMWRIAYAQRAT